jgi:predicted dehydrogenase
MKAAILGAGFMGTIHAENLSHSDIPLNWVMDKDKERGEMLAQKYNATWTPDITKITGDPETEIVIHALPTPYRLEFMKQYIAAGKHILCEKPLARTMEEARRILEALRGYNKVFMVGHVLRFFWEYAFAREMLHAGEIGEPGIVRISRCSGLPASYDRQDNWYLDAKKSGGVLLDLSIHDLDWLLWTFGAVKRGFAQTLATRGDATDYALAILKFKNGVLAHVEGSWAEAPGSFWTAFEISGKGGIIEFDMRDASTLTFSVKKEIQGKKAGTISPESPSLESPYLVEQRHFIDCINSGKKPMTGVNEAFESARLAIGLIESARTNKPVEF